MDKISVYEPSKVKVSDFVVPDNLFATDNDLEIPFLDIRMQADCAELPFLCFGEQARTYDMQGHGTLHFYTDDYRFSSIFNHPENILKHSPASIVEPNFSLFNNTPIAFGLNSIYKKRWIARSMQERGIGVFVDLNVSSKYYKLNMIGVPTGWKSFCTRGYSDRIAYLEYEYGIASEWSGGNPLFVIYGGGVKCRQFAKDHRCIYITPAVVVKKKQKAYEGIQDTIAFLGEPQENVLESSLSKLRASQLSDYRNQLQ